MNTGVFDGGYEAVRRRHVADFEAMLPEYADRIGWSADRVARERLRALRALLAAARRSPWHRKRLAALDADGRNRCLYPKTERS